MVILDARIRMEAPLTSHTHTHTHIHTHPTGDDGIFRQDRSCGAMETTFWKDRSLKSAAPSVRFTLILMNRLIGSEPLPERRWYGGEVAGGRDSRAICRGDAGRLTTPLTMAIIGTADSDMLSTWEETVPIIGGMGWVGSRWCRRPPVPPSDGGWNDQSANWIQFRRYRWEYGGDGGGRGGKWKKIRRILEQIPPNGKCNYSGEMEMAGKFGLSFFSRFYEDGE